MALEREAVTHWFPCGEGRLPIRQWATSSNRVAVEKVLLLHGGSGSWLHWIRNIPALREHLEVYAIDLPGLGDAAMCEVPSDAASASYAHFTVAKGDILLSSSGNSWGKVTRYEAAEEVILNTSTIRMNERPSRILATDFIEKYLQSDACRVQPGLAMTGACQPNFGPTNRQARLFSYCLVKAKCKPWRYQWDWWRSPGNQSFR